MTYRLAAAACAAGLALFAVTPAGQAHADEKTAEPRLCSMDVETGIETCVVSSYRPGPNATAKDIINQQIAEVEQQSGNIVISIMYHFNDLGGDSYIFTASHGCDADLDVDVQLFWVGKDRDNKLRSGKGYAGCQFKIWEDNFWSGAAFGWTGSANSFGLLDSHGSSIKWR